MISDEMIKTIKKQLRNGWPEGEIRESLKKEGYSEEDIQKAFIPQRYDMRSWYLFFAITLALIGFVLFLTEDTWLLLLFSALLFWCYYMEIRRLNL